MFNDEIGEVRLDAIRALSPLVMHGILSDSQLNTVLSMLEDTAAENRLAIHELLARSNLENADCIRHCLRVMLASMRRFPCDRDSVYKCLAAVGAKHSVLVHGMLDELLDLHPIFHTMEQHIDDEFCKWRRLAVQTGFSDIT